MKTGPSIRASSLYCSPVLLLSCSVRHRRTEAEGFEPPVRFPARRFSKPDYTSEAAETTSTYENKADVLASCLALLRQESPDLAAVVEAWDQLPPAIRSGIVAMVNAAGVKR